MHVRLDEDSTTKDLMMEFLGKIRAGEALLKGPLRALLNLCARFEPDVEGARVSVLLARIDNCGQPLNSHSPPRDRAAIPHLVGESAQ